MTTIKSHDERRHPNCERAMHYRKICSASPHHHRRRRILAIGAPHDIYW
jgi:hypothetical protein